MNAQLRQHLGLIGRTVEEFPGRPDQFGTGMGCWDFPRIKKSTDYPEGSWQHALLSRDEGNLEPLKAHRAKRK